MCDESAIGRGRPPTLLSDPSVYSRRSMGLFFLGFVAALAVVGLCAWKAYARGWWRFGSRSYGPFVVQHFDSIRMPPAEPPASPMEPGRWN